MGGRLVVYSNALIDLFMWWKEWHIKIGYIKFDPSTAANMIATIVLLYSNALIIILICHAAKRN